MDSYRDLKNLENSYINYVTECEAALRITLARITNLMEAVNITEERSPFDSIISRIKTFDSIVEKCKRKGYDINIDVIKNHIRDVAGIRIITPFRDDVYKVANLLQHIPGINIAEKRDYIKNPKANGYSSLHLNVQVEIFSPVQGYSKLIPLEIQIRDKAMDMWATIEHIVKYKNDSPSPEVEKRFKKMADILAEFAESAIKLRDFSEKPAH